MAERIPQSVAIRVPLQAYLSSDHVTPATGKTIVVKISKNGAAYGDPSAGATNAVEIGSGSYYVDLTVTDTGTIGPVFVKGTEGTIDTVTAIYDVSVAAVTLPAIPNNWITAAGINSGALNGKGDWSTYAGGDTSGTGTLLARLTAGRATNLDFLDAAVSTRLATSGYTTPPTSAVNAAATWDLATSGHTTSGTFGAAMNAAGSAGDPWSTSLPGAYGTGTAGKIVGTNLDAKSSTLSIYAGGPVSSVTGAVGSVASTVSATLVASGLDAIDSTEPVAPSSGWNFRQRLRWLIMNFDNASRTPGVLTVKTRAGTTSTTQPVSDDGAGNESRGVAS